MLKRAAIVSFALAAQIPTDAAAQTSPLGLDAEAARISTEFDCTTNPLTAENFLAITVPQDDAERLRQISCLFVELYNNGGDDYAYTPTEYLRYTGVAEADIARVASFLPQDFALISERHIQAAPMIAALTYIDQHRVGNPTAVTDVPNIVSVITTRIGKTYFAQNFGTGCLGCDGGVIHAPDIANNFPHSIGAASFTRPHMQTEEYQQDFMLLIALHELGHPFCITRDQSLSGLHNYKEACADIYALTMLAVLRGGVTPAMRDFVMWRRMATINNALDDSVSTNYVGETHGTALIVESYMGTLENRRSFPVSLLEDISDVPRLIGSRHFTRYVNDTITVSTAEAFALMRQHDINSPSWDNRIFAAVRTLVAINSGQITPRNSLTERIIEMYAEGTRYWNPTPAPMPDEPVGRTTLRP